jgi:hypothetical protein
MEIQFSDDIGFPEKVYSAKVRAKIKTKAGFS